MRRRKKDKERKAGGEGLEGQRQASGIKWEEEGGMTEKGFKKVKDEMQRYQTKEHNTERVVGEFAAVFVPSKRFLGT